MGAGERSLKGGVAGLPAGKGCSKTGRNPQRGDITRISTEGGDCPALYILGKGEKERYIPVNATFP